MAAPPHVCSEPGEDGLLWCALNGSGDKQHIVRAENAVMSPVTAQIFEDFAAFWKYESDSSLQWQQFCWLVFLSFV